MRYCIDKRLVALTYLTAYRLDSSIRFDGPHRGAICFYASISILVVSTASHGPVLLIINNIKKKRCTELILIKLKGGVFPFYGSFNR